MYAVHCQLAKQEAAPDVSDVLPLMNPQSPLSKVLFTHSPHLSLQLCAQLPRAVPHSSLQTVGSESVRTRS